MTEVYSHSPIKAWCLVLTATAVRIALSAYSLTFVWLTCLLADWEKLTYLRIDWLTYVLIHWLISWFTDWPTIVWLTDSPTYWLTDRFTDWLADLLTDPLLSDWLTYLLNDWLTYVLIDWEIYWLTGWFANLIRYTSSVPKIHLFGLGYPLLPGS